VPVLLLGISTGKQGEGGPQAQARRRPEGNGTNLAVIPRASRLSGPLANYDGTRHRMRARTTSDDRPDPVALRSRNGSLSWEPSRQRVNILFEIA